jgi:hypothetical protein
MPMYCIIEVKEIPTHSYDELIILTCKGWIDLLYLKREEKILKRGLEH